MDEAQRMRRRGCLLFGGITAAILLLVLALGAFFGLRYARNMVNRLTDAQPLALPAVKLSAAQQDELNARVKTFGDDLRAGKSPAPLELTADDLNAVIDSDPSFARVKHHLFVTIEGSQLGAQISFPAEDLGLSRMRGRFLNATGVFHAAIATNELQITTITLSVKGETLPTPLMREVMSVNLGEKINQDPRAAAELKRLESLEVKDGKLILVPKR